MLYRCLRCGNLRSHKRNGVTVHSDYPTTTIPPKEDLPSYSCQSIFHDAQGKPLVT